MTPMALLDTNACYGKLARDEALAKEEVLLLLDELRHFRKATAYLASCQAATVESLPKSSSISARSRHQRICATAIKLIDGDSSDIGFPPDLGVARERCGRALGHS